MIDSVCRSSISLSAAVELVTAVTVEARASGHAISVAVVDEAGDIIVLARMDDALRPTVEMARDKARTAALMRRDTTDFATHIASRSDLRDGLSSTDDLTTFPGGLPVRKDGVVIGGIGVSGAPPEADIALGQSALAALSGARPS